MPLSIGIIGAGGKVGKKIVSCALKSAEFSLQGALGGASSIGKDLGDLANLPQTGVRVSSFLEDFLPRVDLLIDFSTKESTQEVVKKLLKHPKPIVIGTTGLPPSLYADLNKLAASVPIAVSPNFSLGMTLCYIMISKLPESLKKKFHLSIEETHHIHKKDSPSGTAIALAEILGAQDNISSKREGEVIGEHRIFLENQQEKIELRHEVLTRDVFAEGALTAAKALILMPPGLYSLKDLFS